MTDPLDALLSRVDDPALRDDLTALVHALKAKRKFGLVFNDHLPETVQLPQYSIRAGVKVVLRGDKGAGIFDVQSIARSRAALVDAEGAVSTRAVRELVVVADVGQVIYPGLQQLETISRGGDKPFHVVINAENHHALEALAYTHAGKVDCIYIDPPYNLGGDLTYNDRRVAKEDVFRHSKWLSFMDRRLQLAKNLLKDTGVIIVAIDDTEQAHLRLLMDQVFTASNFIASVVWQGGTKSYSRYVSVGHDYMLIYARNEPALVAVGTQWRERKTGVDASLAEASRLWAESDHDAELTTSKFRVWLKALPKDQRTAGTDRYNTIEDGTGRVFSGDGNMVAPEARPNRSRRPLIHPVTRKPCSVPPNGWRWSDVEMDRRLAAGLIVFGEDEKKIPRYKSYLDEVDQRVAGSVFEQSRTLSGNRLKSILGERRFKFPKDTSVLARWIDLVTQAKSDAVILDFFAGSGSTAQAVMELNAADGGRRQAIVVTNNEVEETVARKLTKEGRLPGDPQWEAQGIFERVTKPRIKTVVTGKREDGSSYSEGMEENVEFLELTFQDPERVDLGMAFEAVAPLLWLRAGACGQIIATRSETFVVADNYGVLFNTDRWRAFVKALPSAATTAFVVTKSDSVFADVAAKFPGHIDVLRLYDDYLTTFTINQQRRKASR